MPAALDLQCSGYELIVETEVINCSEPCSILRRRYWINCQGMAVYWNIETGLIFQNVTCIQIQRLDYWSQQGNAFKHLCSMICENMEICWNILRRLLLMTRWSRQASLSSCCFSFKCSFNPFTQVYTTLYSYYFMF